MNEQRKKTTKVVLIVLLVIALLAGGTFAGIKLFQNKTVEVTPVSGLTLYWAPDSLTLYGEVASDSYQTVKYDKEKTILDILVSEGDTVSAGDPLYQYDASLDAIELELKKSKINSLQYEIDENRKMYKKYAKKDYESTLPTPEPTETPGPTPTPEATVKTSVSKGIGSDSVLLSLIHGEPLRNPNPIRIDELYDLEGEYDPGSILDCFESRKAPEPEYVFFYLDDGTQINYKISFQLVIVPGQGQTKALFASSGYNIDEKTGTHSFIIWDQNSMTQKVCGIMEGFFRNNVQVAYNTKEDKTVMLTDSTEKLSKLLVKFERQPDVTPEPTDAPSGGMSRAEKLALAEEYAKKIRDAEVEQKQLRLDVQKLELQGVDGYIRAEIDGTVSSVKDPKELSDGQAMITVKGKEGYYVRCALGEQYLEQVREGTVFGGYAYETGVVCTGIVTAIDTVPSTDSGYSTDGNVNVSYYPIRIQIQDGDQLQAGQYVEFTMSSENADYSDSLYLYEPYVRTIDGQPYVYIAKDGKLQKTAVTTGKTYFGYVEILGNDVTTEDYIAFPYDKNIGDGAKAKYPN